MYRERKCANLVLALDPEPFGSRYATIVEWPLESDFNEGKLTDLSRTCMGRSDATRAAGCEVSIEFALLSGSTLYSS